MKSLVMSVLFFSSPAFAEIDLSKLSGSWTMNCAQSSADSKHGFMVETYEFTPSGSFKLTRQWYRDSSCKEKTDQELESGTFKLGKENTNNGFNPPGTYEVRYKTKDKADLGLLWVDSAYTKLRVAKGFGKSQNTMLGLFEYKKH